MTLSLFLYTSMSIYIKVYEKKGRWKLIKFSSLFIKDSKIFRLTIQNLTALIESIYQGLLLFYCFLYGANS